LELLKTTVVLELLKTIVVLELDFRTAKDNCCFRTGFWNCLRNKVSGKWKTFKATVFDKTSQSEGR
jgi:hypothetical protein